MQLDALEKRAARAPRLTNANTDACLDDQSGAAVSLAALWAPWDDTEHCRNVLTFSRGKTQLQSAKLHIPP